jgi:hypothetical protein
MRGIRAKPRTSRTLRTSQVRAGKATPLAAIRPRTAGERIANMRRGCSRFLGAMFAVCSVSSALFLAHPPSLTSTFVEAFAMFAMFAVSGGITGQTGPLAQSSTRYRSRTQAVDTLPRRLRARRVTQPLAELCRQEGLHPSSASGQTSTVKVRRPPAPTEGLLIRRRSPAQQTAGRVGCCPQIYYCRAQACSDTFSDRSGFKA